MSYVLVMNYNRACPEIRKVYHNRASLSGSDTSELTNKGNIFPIKQQLVGILHFAIRDRCLYFLTTNLQTCECARDIQCTYVHCMYREGSTETAVAVRPGRMYPVLLASVHCPGCGLLKQAKIPRLAVIRRFHGLKLLRESWRPLSRRIRLSVEESMRTEPTAGMEVRTLVVHRQRPVLNASG